MLQNIEYPGLDDNVTLTYAAPTQNEMCELDEFAYADYQERFVTYADSSSPIQRIEGRPNPDSRIVTPRKDAPCPFGPEASC